MSTISPMHGVIITDELDGVVEQLGVRSELPAVLEMTRNLFPTCNVPIEVEVDREIANHVLLAIVVQVGDISHQTVIEPYERWHHEIGEVCPQGLATSFCLGLEFAA